MIFELLTLWGAGTQCSGPKKHSSSQKEKKQDISVKEFMKEIKDRTDKKMKTEKAYEELRKGIW